MQLNGCLESKILCMRSLALGRAPKHFSTIGVQSSG
jgi:hypothetical protein